MAEPSTPPAPTEPLRRYAARRHTRRLALSHYENFTVVSLALPRRLRQDFFNIYAYCRHADDLADEIADPAESLRQLAALRLDVHRMYQGRPQRSILVALADTVRRYDIPIDPFLALISAFEQDQRVRRYQTYEQLLDYCMRSANPVGHLVLYLCGYRDAQRQRLADHTCTALQLTNFWQDVVPDLARGRIYIPRQDLRRFGVSEDDIVQRRATGAFIEMMRFQVQRTATMFKAGQALVDMVDGPLRIDVALYGRGGQAILDRIRAIGYNVMAQRPTLGRGAKLALLARAAMERLWQ